MTKIEIYRGTTHEPFVTLIDFANHRCKWVEGDIPTADQLLLEAYGGTVLAKRDIPCPISYQILRDQDLGTHELLRIVIRAGEPRMLMDADQEKKVQCAGECPPYVVDPCPAGTVACCVNNVLVCQASCSSERDLKTESECPDR